MAPPFDGSNSRHPMAFAVEAKQPPASPRRMRRRELEGVQLLRARGHREDTEVRSQWPQVQWCISVKYLYLLVLPTH